MTKKSTKSAAITTTTRQPVTSSRKYTGNPRKSGQKHVAKQQSARHTGPALPKRDQLIALLNTPSGTTIEAMTTLTGWQPHTVRGVISAVLRKKLGLNVVCEKTAEGNHYKIIPNAA